MGSEQAKSDQSLSKIENEINNLLIHQNDAQKGVNEGMANNVRAVEEEEEKNTQSIKKSNNFTGPFSKKITSTQPAAKNKSKKLDQ